MSLLSGYDVSDRVRREPGVAIRLVNELCGRRPLDLVALSGQLADPSERAWCLADHAERLAAFPRDEVSRPVLAGSCHRLDKGSRRVSRLLALYPGNDFSHYDIAVLADLDTTETTLRRLFDRHLLFQREPQRYRMHDAVAAFAHRLLHPEEPRRAAGGSAAVARGRHAQTSVARMKTGCVLGNRYRLGRWGYAVERPLRARVGFGGCGGGQ